MKELVPAAPIVRNDYSSIQEIFQKNVIPSYGRFPLAFSHGSGSYLWDVGGRRYLDLGGGIAVCTLGHANPEITETLIEQSKRLMHVSNLYFTGPQGELAQALVSLIGRGKCFFSNSGGEANEGLYKLARKFGHDEGRFEIITAWNSFHGRTLGGISATGQEKIKKGFEPMVQGFRHVPYNDLEAVRKAISPATAAVLIEGIQGESGITPATADYLLGLRELCNEKNLLLLYDAVQCGHFRTGRYMSYQRILESVPGGDRFLPDGISMAKSLGGGFPIGAFWVREPYADLLSAGTHGTTYGGNPLGCAVALKILEVIRRDGLEENVRKTGDFLKQRLIDLVNRYPSVLKTVRGYGFIIGLELAENIRAFAGRERSPALQFIDQLHEAGVLAIPSGTRIIRLLPALNLRHVEAAEGLGIIESVVSRLDRN
ncbi:MAG: acetylornithine/succinylornithine family transaminase [Verrucomicrobiota bacterium]|nr:acetylornithine/succinylornithine family transaminase [Verrucomicrobiota bacterium]